MATFAQVLAWALNQSVGTAARTLADAYVTGARRVSMPGAGQVEYASAAEMERALTALHSALVESARRPAITVVQVGER